MGLFSGIGGLVGGALKAVGLGKIAPFVSMGINALTGNWAAVAMDVAGLMSKIKGLGFLNKVAQLAPLGGFGAANNIGGCFGTGGFNFKDLLNPSRLKDIVRNFRNLSDSVRDFRASAQKVQDMFKVLEETLENREMISAAREQVVLNSTLRAG
jgi:hypothetical protein